MRIIRRRDDRRRIIILNENRSLNKSKIRHPTNHHQLLTSIQAQIKRSGPSRHPSSLYPIFGCEKIQWLLEGSSEVVFVQWVAIGEESWWDGYLMNNLWYLDVYEFVNILSDDLFCVGLHWGFGCWVDVTVDEVLEDELWIFEVTGVVVVGLSVHFLECFSEVFLPPNEFLKIYV